MVLPRGTREPHLLSKPPAQGVPQAGWAVPASRPLAGALLPRQLTCGLLPCLSGPGSLSTYCLQQSRERVRLLPEWGAGAGKPAAALDRNLCRKENIWKQPSDLHATGRECIPACRSVWATELRGFQHHSPRPWAGTGTPRRGEGSNPSYPQAFLCLPSLSLPHL